jgi:hypothetical protein
VFNSKENERDGPMSLIGDKINVCRFLVGKPEGKSLGILEPVWKYNIEMGVEGTEWDGLD